MLGILRCNHNRMPENRTLADSPPIAAMPHRLAHFWTVAAPVYVILHKLNLTVSLDLVLIQKPGQGGVTFEGQRSQK